MPEPMTREALDAYLQLAENIRERFGDNWRLVDDEDMDEVSARTEDSTLGFFTEMFVTSQVHGDDPLEVAGFLAAAIDNVPRMAAMIRKAEAERDKAKTAQAHAVAEVARLATERDKARTLAGVRGDLLDEARTKLERAQEAGRDAEAERDAAREQVKRLRALAEEALHLRMYGENAPGGTETWAGWDRKAPAALRALDGTGASDA